MEREQSLKFMHDLLRALIARKGSDLFITAGFPPAMKVDGKVTPVSQQSLSPVHTQELARSVMTDKQVADLQAGVGEAQQAEAAATEAPVEGAEDTSGAEYPGEGEDISMEEVLGPGTHKKPVANEDADLPKVESQTV